MPIYEYRCSACGHELEALQKFSDAPLANCPSCNASTLVKLLSAAGFQLKGSGWYATDFKGSGGKPAKTDAAPKSESGAGTEGGAKGESKGEAKSETPVSTKSDARSETASGTSAPAAKTGTSPAT